MTRYVEHTPETVPSVAECFGEQKEGWKYGFYYAATLKNGDVVDYKTEPTDHNQFEEDIERMEEMKSFVKKIFQEDFVGFLTLGHTTVRGAHISTFKALPVAYEPV